MSNISGVNGTFSGAVSIGSNLTVSGNLTASQAVTFNAGTGTFSQITTNNQQSALTTDNVNLYSNNTGTVTVGNTTGTLAIRKPTTTLTNLTSSGTITGNTLQSVATTNTVNLYTTSGGGAIINLGGNSTIVNVGVGTSNTVQMGSLSSTVNVNALTLNLTAQNNVNIPVGTGGSLLSCSKDFTVVAGRTAFLNTISSTTNPSNCVLFQNAGTGTITIGDGASTTLINGGLSTNTIQPTLSTATVNLYTNSTGATINIATGSSNTINIGNFLSTVAVPSPIALTNVSLNKITPSYGGTIPTYGTGDIGYSLFTKINSSVSTALGGTGDIINITLPAHGVYTINYGIQILFNTTDSYFGYGLRRGVSTTVPPRLWDRLEETFSAGRVDNYSRSQTIKTSDWGGLNVDLITITNSIQTVQQAWIYYFRIA